MNVRESSPNSRLAIVGALVCVVLALAVAVTAAWRRTHDARIAARPGGNDALLGTPLDPPKIVTDAVLRDGTGRETRVVSGDERTTTMVFFGYTHCPDMCPLALASLGRAYRTLAPAARTRTRIVFVTVDPARDTPPAIARYVRTFDPHIVGLTGDPRALAALRDAYGVRVDARTHEISHGTTVFAVDAHLHVRVVYPPDTTSRDFAHDLTLLAS
ncbi:MAG: SCO family protein [Vulcanimicrobiaceae bacterium]